MIKWFGCDKQIFSLASVLCDHCLDCFAQHYLIVVVSSCIEVLAVPQLQSLPQQVRQHFFVLQLVGSKAQQVQNLFIAENLCWRDLFLLLTILLRHYNQIITLYIIDLILCYKIYYEIPAGSWKSQCASLPPEPNKNNSMRAQQLRLSTILLRRAGHRKRPKRLWWRAYGKKFQ